MRIDEQAIRACVLFAYSTALFLSENKQAADLFMRRTHDNNHGTSAWDALGEVDRIEQHELFIKGLAAAAVHAKGVLNVVLFDDESHPFPFTLPTIRMHPTPDGPDDGYDHSNCLDPQSGVHAIDCPAHPRYQP